MKDTLRRLGASIRSSPRLVRLGLALAVLCLGREVWVHAALRHAGASARRLGEASRQILPDPTPSQGLRREALWWLLEPEADERPAAEPPSVEPAARGTATLPRLGPAPAPVSSLASAVVLDLAARGAVPRGITRPAERDLPAGIEILDGGGLGIGWFPRDRLILVDGVPVTDRAEVVRRVLEGRARRAPVITATLARRTRSGVVTYQVLVEQPYLPTAAEDDLAREISPPETSGPP